MRELALLQHIYQRSANLGEKVIVGPGDDMAVVRLGGERLLVAVDQVADGVHFDSARASLEQIGRKAITRNLSDVAAMAATPVAAVASAMLPRSMGEPRAQQLFNAMQSVTAAYNCPLVGGDVGMWDQPLQISVTVLAEPAGVEPVLRSGAKAGDAVFVSGELGNAWAHGSAGHLDFEPRVKLARALAQQLGSHLHSMIDLSDGLGSDLPRICEQSEVAAVVDVAALPLRPPLRDRPDLHQPWQAALSDGEDYELCFTVDAAAAEALPTELENTPLRQVGRIVPRPDESSGGALALITLRWEDGRITGLEQSGWEHGK